MSKLLKNVVGIDISKKYFDAVLLKDYAPSETIHKQFSQKTE